jgi:hypothetical protein
MPETPTPEQRAAEIGLYTRWEGGSDYTRTWDDVRAEIAQAIKDAIIADRAALGIAPPATNTEQST